MSVAQQNLFHDLPPNPPANRLANPSTTAGSTRASGCSRAGAPQQHLLAAQKLAKKLRAKRRGRTQRQQAGIKICQHLIAMLDEAGHPSSSVRDPKRGSGVTSLQTNERSRSRAH